MAKKESMRDWAAGGGFMLGLGVGFFVLKPLGALAFVGSILAGIGLGLIVAATVAKK